MEHSGHARVQHSELMVDKATLRGILRGHQEHIRRTQRGTPEAHKRVQQGHTKWDTRGTPAG